jgi:hypothetical protein
MIYLVLYGPNSLHLANTDAAFLVLSTMSYRTKECEMLAMRLQVQSTCLLWKTRLLRLRRSSCTRRWSKAP